MQYFGGMECTKMFLLNLSNVIRIVGHVIFIKFCGVLCFRSEWWNLTKCSLFFVTMKSFTSRATVRKMCLFFHDVLWCPSDLQTLVHNKTLSANFWGTFLCKVKNSQYIQHYLPPKFGHLTSTTIQETAKKLFCFKFNMRRFIFCLCIWNSTAIQISEKTFLVEKNDII